MLELTIDLPGVPMRPVSHSAARIERRPVAALSLAMLVATIGCGPRAGHPKTYEIHPHPRPIRAIAARGGEVWAATFGGASHWSADHLAVLTSVDGLPASSVADVAIARKGTVWIGTEDGLARLRGSRLRSFATGPVLAVAADAGNTAWAIVDSRRTSAPTGGCAEPVAPGPAASTSPYLLQVVGARSRRFEPQPPVGEPLALAAVGTDVWVGGTEGAAHWTGEAWRKLDVMAPVTLVRADADHRVWMATARGLFAAAPSGEIDAPRGGEFFLGAARPKGVAVGTTGLWVATEKALYRYDGERWHRRAVGGGAAATERIIDVTMDQATGVVYGATQNDVYSLSSAGEWVAAPRGERWTSRPRVVALIAPPGAGVLISASRLAPSPTLVTGKGTLLEAAPRIDITGPPDTGTDLLPTLGTGTGSLRARLKGAAASAAGISPASAIPGPRLPGFEAKTVDSIRVFVDGSRAGLAAVEQVNGLAVIDRWLLIATDVGLFALDFAAGGEPIRVPGSEGVGARAIAADGGVAWAVLQDARTAEPLGAGEIRVEASEEPVLRVRDLDLTHAVVGRILSVGVVPGGAVVWLGAERGIARLDPTRTETFTAGEGPGEGPFRNMAVSAAGVAVWAVACDGMAVYSGASWRRVDLPAAWGPVGAVTPGGADTVWLGIGVRVVEVDALGKVRKGPFPVPGKWVTALAFDAEGALWIGTASGAIARVPGVGSSR